MVLIRYKYARSIGTIQGEVFMNTYQHFLMKKHPVRMIRNFRELVYGSAEKFGDLPAFKLRNRVITYGEFMEDYRGLCTAFLEMGFEDSKIAVIGANSYGWIVSYLAAATIGVAVPLDKELDVEDIENFIDAADCKLLLGDDVSLRKLASGNGDAKNIETYSINEDSSLYKKTIFDLIWDGDLEYRTGSTEFDTLEIDPEEMHVLLFTSGTTGNAKGVCLSQKNICANIMSIASMVKVDPSRHALSVLPIHHTYESTIGHLLLLSAGGCISYCDGLRYVGKNMKEYSPSVIIAVPLLLEFMLRTIDKSIRAGLPAKYTQDPEMPLNDLLASLPAILRMVVMRKVRKSLGGKLKLLIVGAAAIKPEIIAAFDALGITTYQGYGLTETAPLLAGNNDFYRNIEAVGLPIHGVEISIFEPNDEGVGEIMARGDNIMLGYYNDPEATAAVMHDGFFRTGDLGRFDEEGFLYITGRCKNVIVTKNGKNIYPEELEDRLLDNELVEETIVIGVPSRNKDDITVKAKIYPSMDALKEQNGGEEPDTEKIASMIKNVVEGINDKMPAYKRISSIEVVREPFEKTTTKKIKRFGANVE